jgi:hypothetical protein
MKAHSFAFFDHGRLEPFHKNIRAAWEPARIGKRQELALRAFAISRRKIDLYDGGAFPDGSGHQILPAFIGRHALVLLRMSRK